MMLGHEINQGAIIDNLTKKTTRNLNDQKR